MELFKLFGTIAVNNAAANAEIDNTTGKAESSEGRISSAFKKIGMAVASAFAIDKIKDFGLSCIQVAADAGALASQFTQVFGSVEGEASTSLEKIASDAGMITERMKGSYVQIAAFAKTTGMDSAEAMELANRGMILAADSAAFYDRSLEATTESLQSFLKGNYENDAALGLSCTETTRNAAANALYGKSFKDLSESQKQLTLLKMVEDANRASGAMGQAAREADTWTNQTGNLTQAWTNLKAKIGKNFLEPAIAVVKRMVEALTTLTGKIPDVVNWIQTMWGKFKEFGTYVNTVFQPVFKALGDLFTTVKNAVMNAISPLTSWVSSGQAANQATSLLRTAIQGLADRLVSIIQTINQFITWLTSGSKSAEAFKKVVIVLAGAFATFKTAMSIGSIISSVINVIKGAVTAFGALNTVMLANPIGLIVAAVAALIAIFVTLYNKCEWFRNGVNAIWEAIKRGVSALWNSLKPLVDSIVNAFKQAVGAIQAAWKVVQPFFAAIWEGIKKVFAPVVSVFKNLFKGAWESIKAVWNAAIGFFKSIFDGIANIFKVIKSVLTGDFKGAWEGIKGIWNAAGDFFKSVFNLITAPFKGVATFFKGIFSDAWNSITGIFGKLGSWFSDLWGKVKGIFKLPHFKVTGSLNPIKWFDEGLPKIGVEWYAKGGIMKNPTAFGWNPATNKPMVGGEAGAEAIAPIETLKQYVNEAVNGANNGLSDKLDKLCELLSYFLPLLLAKKGDILLDTGALVGEIAPEMNKELYRIMKWREGGGV